jgi:molybdate transport system permease protein
MIFDALVISLKMSLTSIAASSIVGVFLANFLYKSKLRIIGFIEGLILLPMFLPPSIIGYGLLIIIGKNGPIGNFLYSVFNIKLVFTWWAGAMATFIIALPLIYQNSKSAFLSINKECEEAGKIDGATTLQIFFRIKLPMALRSILCGIVLGFARAFGEFGATLMVAGNIPSKTQNIPTAVYYAVEAGDMKTANELFFIVLLIGIAFITIFNYLISKNDY